MCNARGGDEGAVLGTWRMCGTYRCAMCASVHANSMNIEHRSTLSLEPGPTHRQQASC